MLKAITASSPDSSPLPIYLVTAASAAPVIGSLAPNARAWAQAMDFAGRDGEVLVVPDSDGAPQAAFFGAGNDTTIGLGAGRLPGQLPPGLYRLAGEWPDRELAALGWELGAYAFDRYKKTGSNPPLLVCPSDIDEARLTAIAGGMRLARDMINTPANDMGPADIEHAIRHLGDAHEAEVSVTKGDALIQDGFPMIHAVGRASTREPRLIDLTWQGGDGDGLPKVTLVGKGVCFDTGGLDLKPSSGMILMKKDMGGSAATIALASMIMETQLPVQLRLLVPAVENSLAGDAFRPGDILQSRKGLTVEIGNTDAEGRLVLADALTLADEDEPDLMIDMATLTGAARVAMGPEVVPFFTKDDALADALFRHGETVADPVWRLPLWEPYLKSMKSPVADINNAGTSRFGGAITAALFLSRFVSAAKAHVHFDIYGWVPSARPGQPEGGEAQAVRALFSMLEDRYCR